MTTPEPTPGRHPLLRLWPGLIVWLIVLHVGGMVAFTVVAASGGPPQVEPKYYEKAVAWDETVAQRATNRRLGWRASWQAFPGHARLTLTDAAGAPLGGASCTVELFHRAHALQRVEGSLTPAGEGVYELKVNFARAGDHEFRLTVRRGAETFTDIARVTVPAAAGGSP